MTTAAPPATSPAAALKGKGAARPLRTRIQGRQTFARAVGSEWIKIRSLRSTWITSAIAIVTSVLIGAGLTIGMGKTAEYADTARYSLIAGTTLGQIVVAVLAALVITGEYVPHRGRLLWAKALVISFVAFLLGSLSTLLSWAISAPFLGEHAGSLTDAHYLGFFWGSGLAYAGIAMMTLGLGFLLRSTAGSLTVVTVLLFVIEIPLSLMAMKWEWAAKIIGILPGKVAVAVTDPFQLTQTWGSQAGGATSFLEHSHAILVFAAWALIPMLIGWPVFSRRDT